MLPGKSGFEMPLKKLARGTQRLAIWPILMLTARGQTRDARKSR